MAIISISEMKIDSAFWYIIFSAIFDFVDGKMARLFRTSSKLGPHIDSLADVVSFGVAPAFFVYNFVVFQGGRFSPFYLLPFVYLSAVVMRLARFNVIGENSQKEFYYGLSSPISAIFITSVISLLNRFSPSFVLLREVVTAVILFLSFLMLSKIEFPVFKGSKRTEKLQILYFVLVLILLIFLRYIFLIAAISLYIIFGILSSLFKKEADE
jgi:CDP-diacylglycerol--serine O-phosphatidyltransferase